MRLSKPWKRGTLFTGKLLVIIRDKEIDEQFQGNQSIPFMLALLQGILLKS
jgi:hypothetical protein